MSDAFVASIRVLPYPFAPRGWAFCNGQLMSISQNFALYTLLGTMYGGDGTSTFALPDFRGRVPLHWGEGPGLTPRDIGEAGGSEHVTLQAGEMPTHKHEAQSANQPANTEVPTDAIWTDVSSNALAAYSAVTAPRVSMHRRAGGRTGGDEPHENRMPGLGLNFCIALEGIYPPRG